MKIPTGLRFLLLQCLGAEYGDSGEWLYIYIYIYIYMYVYIPGRAVHLRLELDTAVDCLGLPI